MPTIKIETKAVVEYSKATEQDSLAVQRTTEEPNNHTNKGTLAATQNGDLPPEAKHLHFYSNSSSNCTESITLQPPK